MNQYSPTGFRVLPVVIKNLLIINALFFVATWVMLSRFNIDITQYLGLFFFESDFFRPHQYVTYMFMHGGFTHLFFNMFALWMFGSVLENVWGPRKFLIYYFVTGIGAAVIHTAVNWYTYYSMNEAIGLFYHDPTPQNFAILINDHFSAYREAVFSFLGEWSNNLGDPRYLADVKEFLTIKAQESVNIPTVGASGAVFGLLLAFGMMFPNSVIYIYFFFPMKAKYFVILYGALELYGGINNAAGDNVAHFAHLGGMIFGFFLVRAWKKKTIY